MSKQEFVKMFGEQLAALAESANEDTNIDSILEFEYQQYLKQVGYAKQTVEIEDNV